MDTDMSMCSDDEGSGYEVTEDAVQATCTAMRTPVAAVATADYSSCFCGSAGCFRAEFRARFSDLSRAGWNGVHQ